MGLLGMSKDELVHAIARLFGLLCEGKSDEEAMDLLGLSADQYRQLKDALYLQEGERLTARSREEIYLDYILEQRSCLRQLGQIVREHFSGKQRSKQLSALVGAVRAQSEIFKEVLRAGQDLGVIVKAPTRKEVVGGVVFAEMTSEQFQTAILRELSGMDELIRKYGDENIIEVSAGPVHRALPPGPTEKPRMREKGKPTQKAKRTKRFAGRLKAPRKKVEE